MQNAAQRAAIALALVMLSALPAQALTEPTPANTSRAPHAPSTRRPGARSAPEDPFEGVELHGRAEGRGRPHPPADPVEQRCGREGRKAISRAEERHASGLSSLGGWRDLQDTYPQQQNQVRENLRARHAAAQQRQQKAVPHNSPQPAR